MSGSYIQHRSRLNLIFLFVWIINKKAVWFRPEPPSHLLGLVRTRRRQQNQYDDIVVEWVQHPMYDDAIILILSSSSSVNSYIGVHATHFFCRRHRRLVRTSPNVTTNVVLVSDSLEFSLHGCHWIHTIQWSMTKSKYSTVNTSNI